MRFTSVALATLLSVAHGDTINVTVGFDDSTQTPGLFFFPNSVNAKIDDVVTFYFKAGNHSVQQSDFENPCQNIDGGIKSGFHPANANSTDFPTHSYQVTSMDTTWLFCGQVGHCERGMAMVVNPPTDANTTQTLEAYIAAAAALGGSGSDAPSTGDDGSDAPSTGDDGSDAPSTGDDGSDAPSTGDDGSDAPSTGDDGSDASATPNTNQNTVNGGCPVKNGTSGNNSGDDSTQPPPSNTNIEVPSNSSTPTATPPVLVSGASGLKVVGGSALALFVSFFALM